MARKQFLVLKTESIIESLPMVPVEKVRTAFELTVQSTEQSFLREIFVPDRVLHFASLNG